MFSPLFSHPSSLYKGAVVALDNGFEHKSLGDVKTGLTDLVSGLKELQGMYITGSDKNQDQMAAEGK